MGGPPGIDAWVKRNRLSQKKNFGLCGHWRPLEGPGEARHCQGPPGIDAWVKRNRLSQKKIRPLEAAGGSRGGPTLSGTIRDHQGSSFWSKETIGAKKKFGLCGLEAAGGSRGGPTIRDHQGSTLGSKGTV